MYFNTLEFKALGECAHVRVVCVNASEQLDLIRVIIGDLELKMIVRENEQSSSGAYFIKV